jgi:hypothetical protein
MLLQRSTRILVHFVLGQDQADLLWRDDAASSIVEVFTIANSFRDSHAYATKEQVDLSRIKRGTRWH